MSITIVDYSVNAESIKLLQKLGYIVTIIIKTRGDLNP